MYSCIYCGWPVNNKPGQVCNSKSCGDKEMREYPKINTVFKRDLNSSVKRKPLLEGSWSEREFEYLANNQWHLSEKIDGTNIRIGFQNDRIRVLGRKADSMIPPEVGNFIIDTITEDDWKKRFPSPTEVTLYGEGVGPKIQKGSGYGPTASFILFGVRIEDWWLRQDDIQQIADCFGIRCSPILETCTLYEAIEKVKDGIPSSFGDFKAEGVVARPSVPLLKRNGRLIMTKIKSKDFD